LFRAAALHPLAIKSPSLSSHLLLSLKSDEQKRSAEPDRHTPQPIGSTRTQSVQRSNHSLSSRPELSYTALNLTEKGAFVFKTSQPIDNCSVPITVMCKMFVLISRRFGDSKYPRQAWFWCSKNLVSQLKQARAYRLSTVS
jgi:hypothetical protein